MELPKEEAASSGKKKKQKKQKSNKTQSLNDFLARPSIGSKYSSKDPPKRTDSWADAMDERGDAEEVTTTWQGGGEFDRSQLPSAPRKAQARNIDRGRLPKAPPYTVYLGNLSYECNEDDIVHFFGRKNLTVKEVRLPTDSGTSRLKGFGYAELESVAAILDALELTGETLKNRSVTIDLATSKSADGDGGRERFRRDSDDRTESDWRRGSGDDGHSPPGPRDYQNGPTFGDRYERGRGYGDDYRGGGYDNRRNYDQGRGGYERGGYEERGGYAGRGGYEGRGRRGYGSGGWNERPENSRDYGDYDGGYGRRRQEGRYEQDRRGPPRYDDGYGRGRSPPGRPEPQERPRLQLQPRSRPVDSAPTDGRSAIFGAAQPVDTAAREMEIEQKMMREKERAGKEEEKAQKERELREEREKGSVFGGARPVDTASREKEIEEKLRRRQEEDEKLLQRRQRKGSDSERKARGRDRKGSDRSGDGEEGGRGQERYSRSPERLGTRREKEEGGEQGEDGRLHDDHIRVREGRPKERQREDRGRRERSIEEDWAEGGRGGRRVQPLRSGVDSGDREPGTERSRGVGRRGGWRGRGVGVPGTEGERGDQRSGERDRQRPKAPPTREDGPLKKYEEPHQQPAFSQPSRYAMLDMEGDEAIPGDKEDRPQAEDD